ncbi:hypothetical protein K438DRAFT_124791 [Mycena galopus ATCC 62051]|nr:hypothetical protein K438DRAFT_124791 [Mycena galopus ATCC 62051]
MPSDDQDLCTIRQAEQKRATTLLVFNDMKSSLLSQINSEELLQSAPTAISSVGACFVASSSPKALVMLKDRLVTTLPTRSNNVAGHVAIGRLVQLGTCQRAECGS